jgi:hypothetical protein
MAISTKTCQTDSGKLLGLHSTMNNSPEASQLVLLSRLPDAASGTKVRFLGWFVYVSTLSISFPFPDHHTQSVDIYDSMSAILHLKDRFASTAVPSTSGSASVNVAYVLDALNLELTQVGAWVNVIGYVRNAADGHSDSGKASCLVDAVVIWSAGAIKLDEYEATVRDLQATTT